MIGQFIRMHLPAGEPLFAALRRRLIILVCSAGLLLCRAEVVADDAAAQFARQIQVAADLIGKWELGPARELVGTLFGGPNASAKVFDKLELKKETLIAEFGPFRACRLVRTSALLDFSRQFRYAMVFERNIMHVLFNAYESGGKWNLVGFTIGRDYDDLYPKNSGLDPAKAQAEALPIDGTVESLAKFFAAGEAVEQADFIMTHGRFADRANVSKMVRDADTVRTESLAAMGDVVGVKLLTLRKAGDLLRGYSYAVLLEHGYLGVHIEVMQLKEGEWTISRMQCSLLVLP